MDVGSLEADLHIAQAEVGAARESIARLAEELAELRTRWAAVGVDDPRRILSALLQAQDQNRELQDKLAARLDDDSLARLRWLEEQNRDFNAERERLQFELQEERGKQLADRINNLQLQQLTDAQQQFDVIKRGYDMRISELNGALSELVDGRADPTDPLFPNCVALDEDPRLNEAGHLIDDEVPDLHQLARVLARDDVASVETRLLPRRRVRRARRPGDESAAPTGGAAAASGRRRCLRRSPPRSAPNA